MANQLAPLFGWLAYLYLNNSKPLPVPWYYVWPKSEIEPLFDDLYPFAIVIIISFFLKKKIYIKNLSYYSLVANHRLEDGRESLSNRLGSFHDRSHLFQLFFCKFDITRFPVFFQARGFGRSWNSNQALRSNPGQGDLCDRATLFGG